MGKCYVSYILVVLLVSVALGEALPTQVTSNAKPQVEPGVTDGIVQGPKREWPRRRQLSEGDVRIPIGDGQTTDVVTADVDGDGRPEFVAGLAAFKAVNHTTGKVLWQANIPAAHAPVIADLDADGFCKIFLGCTDGKIRAYR
jgi:hypothetical protein